MSEILKRSVQSSYWCLHDVTSSLSQIETKADKILIKWKRTHITCEGKSSRGEKALAYIGCHKKKREVREGPIKACDIRRSEDASLRRFSSHRQDHGSVDVRAGPALDQFAHPFARSVPVFCFSAPNVFQSTPRRQHPHEHVRMNVKTGHPIDMTWLGWLLKAGSLLKTLDYVNQKTGEPSNALRACRQRRS